MNSGDGVAFQVWCFDRSLDFLRRQSQDGPPRVAASDQRHETTRLPSFNTGYTIFLYHVCLHYQLQAVSQSTKYCSWNNKVRCIRRTMVTSTCRATDWARFMLHALRNVLSRAVSRGVSELGTCCYSHRGDSKVSCTCIGACCDHSLKLLYHQL